MSARNLARTTWFRNAALASNTIRSFAISATSNPSDVIWGPFRVICSRVDNFFWREALRRWLAKKRARRNREQSCR